MSTINSEDQKEMYTEQVYLSHKVRCLYCGKLYVPALNQYEYVKLKIPPMMANNWCSRKCYDADAKAFKAGRANGKMYELLSSFIATIRKGEKSLMIGADFVCMSREMFNSIGGGKSEHVAVSLYDAIAVLNDALKADPKAITKLIQQRVPCNEHLADHPTIQVGKIEEGYEVGLLGILNGIFGVNVDGWGYITATMDEGDIIEFSKTKCAK